MTETLGSNDMGARFAAGLQRFGAMLGKAGFGLFLIAAAIAGRHHLHRPDAGDRRGLPHLRPLRHAPAPQGRAERGRHARSPPDG
jgi:hypothetical protein